MWDEETLVIYLEINPRRNKYDLSKIRMNKMSTNHILRLHLQVMCPNEFVSSFWAEVQQAFKKIELLINKYFFDLICLCR